MWFLTHNYLTRGFWGDEAWTSLISQLPYTQMLKTTAADFHPPAYYTIVELLYKFLPPGEIATRCISIFFYFATAFIVYKLASFSSVILSPKGEGSGKEILRTETLHSVQSDNRSTQNDGLWGKVNLFGLLSAIAVLVNPIFFTYAFEARNYTMFAFAATGSVYFLLRLSRKFTLWSASLFIVFSTLGIYTHYYMFFILAAQGLYILLFDRKLLLRSILLYAACAILYLPWIPFLYHQVTSVGESYWIGSIDTRTHYEALMRILGGEQENIFKPILFRLSLVLLIVGLIQHLRQKSFEKPYILIWLWATIPFILASLPGLTIDGIHLPFRPIFFWRYLIGLSVPLSMVVVHASLKLPPVLFKLSLAAVIVLSFAVDVSTFSQYPYGFKQVYEEKIVGKIAPDDMVVTVLPSFAEVYYYRNRNKLQNTVIILPEGLVQFSGKSLLDAYVQNGAVKLGGGPQGNFVELRPGPSIVISAQ